MARIRTIKPDFWTDGRMISLSFEARLFYIGTWNFALCDHGHLPDDALGLKLKILPADNVDPQALLDELMTSGRIVRIKLPDGRTFLHILRLEDHQKVDGRWQSRCPVCSYLAETHASLDEPRRDSPELPATHAGGEGKGKESNGGEGRPASHAAEPSRRCSLHLSNDNPPNCGKCKEARLGWEHWTKTQPTTTAVPKPTKHIPGLCDAHRQPEDTCEMCARDAKDAEAEAEHARAVIYGRFAGIA